MSDISRRSFFNLFRGSAESREKSRAESRAEKAAEAPTRSFDIRDFYRQREILGLVGETPPPIETTTEVRVATTSVGSMKRVQS